MRTVDPDPDHPQENGARRFNNGRGNGQLQENINEAIHESLSSIEDALATVASEVTRQGHDLKGALQPIHSNAEYVAVETDKQWGEIRKLRTAVAVLSDRVGSLESLERDRHKETMAALASLGARVKTADQLMAEQAPEKRHPAAER